MALFIDGRINGLEDLQRYESRLLDVSSVEQIDVSAKMALAGELIAAELLMFLMRQSSRATGNPIFAFSGEATRRAMGMRDVVVTEPLRRWHALKSIELTYEDAYNNQLNDRYQGKWQQYKQRALAAGSQLLQIGVGIATDPIRVADEPLLVAVAGSLPTATYYVRVTWVNRGGLEGEPSDVVALTTVDSTQLIVTSPAAPVNAAGWNIYAGIAPDSVFLQNGTPLSVQQTDWILPTAGLQPGRPPGTGQPPDRYVVNDHVLQRG